MRLQQHISTQCDFTYSLVKTSLAKLDTHNGLF